MMYEQTILHPRHGKTQDKICIFRLLESFNNVTQKSYHRTFSISERQCLRALYCSSKFKTLYTELSGNFIVYDSQTGT